MFYRIHHMKTCKPRQRLSQHEFDFWTWKKNGKSVAYLRMTLLKKKSMAFWSRVLNLVINYQDSAELDVYEEFFFLTVGTMSWPINFQFSRGEFKLYEGHWIIRENSREVRNDWRGSSQQSKYWTSEWIYEMYICCKQILKIYYYLTWKIKLLEEKMKNYFLFCK